MTATTSAPFTVLPEPPAPPPLFTDLSPWLDGTAQPEVPTIAPVLDTALFYAGRLNEIHGEPGVGKTNVVLAAIAAELAAGGRALVIDPEDTPRGFATRARLLGIDPEAIRSRVAYLHNPEPDAIADAQGWARDALPTLVVLDGLAEAIASAGLCEDAAGDVLGFMKTWLRPFAEAGAAVVVADHVTKATEGRGRFARGSGAKLGRYDGAVYQLELGKPYAPGVSGFVRLRVAKDRHGGIGAVVGTVAAELCFDPHPLEDQTIAEFRQVKQSEGPFRPTVVMDKVLAHLRLYDRDTKSGIAAAIHSKRSVVFAAIDCLAQDGAITIEPRGKSHEIRLTTGSPKP